MKLKIGDKVTLPRKWTYGRRRFVVNKVYKNNDVQLKFLGGKEKSETIDRYSPNEVIRI